MKASRFTPRKSLRAQLMIWLILFSVAPLAFIAGYSLVQYQQAIDKVLSERLDGNRREIEVILGEIETAMLDKINSHTTHKGFIFHLSRNNTSSARKIARNWMSDHIAQTLFVFNREGRLDIALTRSENGEVERRQNLESRHAYLPKFAENKFKDADRFTEVRFDKKRKRGQLRLAVFSKIRSKQGRLVGYIEETIRFDTYLAGLKNRLNIEMLFFLGEDIVASHQDLELVGSKYFNDQYESQKDRIFEYILEGVPYGFALRPLDWGGNEFFMGIGASKQAVIAVLNNVKVFFFGVMAVVIALVIFMSLVISQSLLKPLNELVTAIQKADFGEELVRLPVNSETELGILTESYNEMFERVHNSQSKLRENINELESANTQIRDTQAKLVHSAKMASLGQLVAGVAHELNNPIGFIYSNMDHLRDYSNKLIGLVEVAEKDGKKLAKAKEDAEFDYIVKDLPKLIKSCEDGARRTRDIVLGLRNFSRLEEAKLKEVNLHEGLENTLNLLGGETKGRVTIEKKFGEIPKIKCYPSQLNQVFMNILSNAVQAISGKGTVTIATAKIDKDFVSISIKDTGRGMDKETQAKIFDPFFTTKSVGQGTGLGMSISYGIIQKHDGDLQLNSKPGKGTEFVIKLPIKGPSA